MGGRDFWVLALMLMCFSEHLAEARKLTSVEPELDPKCHDKKDIIIVLDASSSIKDPKWKIMKEYVAKLVGRFVVARNLIRFDVFSFNSVVQTAEEIPFDGYTDLADLQERIRNMGRTGRGTKLGKAIAHINDKVLPNTRENVDKVVWVLTDGKDRDEELLEAESARMAGKVQIDVLGISYGDKEIRQYYKERLFPYVNSLIEIENMDQFSDQFIDDLANKLCNEPDDLKEPCYEKRDIIIVLDASNSIKDDEWENMKIFVADLVAQFHVAHDSVRFDVFTFNRKVDTLTEIKFGSYNNLYDLRKKILSLTKHGGGTKFGRAVEYINDNVIGRTRILDGVDPIVWVVTDGKDRNETLLMEQTKRLGDKAEIDALGITRKKEDLKEYFSERIQAYVHKVIMIEDMDESFTKDLLVQVSNELCGDRKKPGPLNPDVPPAEIRECYRKKDIIVVLDSSRSINKKGWEEMKEFVSEVIGNFDIAEHAVQFDVFRFNKEVSEKDEIEFGDYNSLEELQQLVLDMKKDQGGTNLGNAFGYINDKVLARGRPNVDKLVWVLTDGRSKDEDVLKEQAQILRQNKAEIYVLAIEGIEDELTQSYWRKLRKEVDYFARVKKAKKKFSKNLLKQISTELCD